MRGEVDGVSGGSWGRRKVGAGRRGGVAVDQKGSVRERVFERSGRFEREREGRRGKEAKFKGKSG